MRTVVVSGGGTGIGRAIAAAFAREGDHVVIVGRRAGVLEAATASIGGGEGRAVQTVAADVATAQGAAAVRSFLVKSGALPVHVLVHAAGGVDASSPTSVPDVLAVWQRDFRQNVLTAVCLTETLRADLAEPGGRVLLIGSIAAVNGGGDSYSAAKAALHGWAVSLAKDLAPRGITVNAIAPGYVHGTEFFGDRMTQARHERLVAQTLAGRAGKPEDVAAAARYLGSEDASFVTGQVVHVNGGAAFGR